MVSNSVFRFIVFVRLASRGLRSCRSGVAAVRCSSLSIKMKTTYHKWRLLIYEVPPVSPTQLPEYGKISGLSPVLVPGTASQINCAMSSRLAGGGGVLLVYYMVSITGATMFCIISPSSPLGRSNGNTQALGESVCIAVATPMALMVKGRRCLHGALWCL